MAEADESLVTESGVPCPRSRGHVRRKEWPRQMRVVAIIQARMGSTRLPGKVLADIGGRSMLGRVCDRARRAALVDQVVVATTLEPDDQQVVDECACLQVACFRGSTEDVLQRYHQAARAFGADAVVRITADCPLIDPQVIDLVVAAFQKGGQAPISAKKGVCSVLKIGDCPLLYASNTVRRTWPRGLDVEVTTAAALARACREAREPYQRTHVTPYIYEHPDLFRLLAVTQRVPGPQDLGHWRWTVDVPEDLDFVRAVYGRLGGGETFSWRDVQQLLAREPALAELNRHVRQKQLGEG
jgi:spore coat polysaccharide biosynthesis protein SpsF